MVCLERHATCEVKIVSGSKVSPGRSCRLVYRHRLGSTPSSADSAGTRLVVHVVKTTYSLVSDSALQARRQQETLTPLMTGFLLLKAVAVLHRAGGHRAYLGDVVDMKPPAVSPTSSVVAPKLGSNSAFRNVQSCFAAP